jgi:FkbM family methyltransferase
MIKTLRMIYLYIIRHPLCRNRKFTCLIKFILWQIRSIFVKNELIVEWVNNTKMSLTKGNTGLTGNYYCGFMEYEDMMFLLHYLRDDDLFIDVGANVGAYTLLASGVVGAKSHSYEPIISTVRQLTHQIEINKLQDLVTISNKGVGSEVGKIFFTNNIDTTNHVVLNNAYDNVTEVSVTTLDKQYKLESSAVIKIDVEGYESFVIDGGEEFFSSLYLRAIIIELNGLGENFGRIDSDIDAKFRQYGFNSIQYNPQNRKIEETLTFDTGENTIYVRNVSEAIERCRTAEKVVVKTASNLLI